MMRRVKKFSWSAIAVIFALLLFLTAGCSQPVEEGYKPPVESAKQMPKATTTETAAIALKFTPQDSTTYKVTTGTEKNLKFEGSLPNQSDLKGGRQYSEIQMTFTQQIQNVDEKGNAVAEITIKELKYSSVHRNRTIMNFDSSKVHNPRHPLAQLIGQSYVIEIAPTGEVLKVVDTKKAQAAVTSKSTFAKTALALLKADAIKRRHGTLILPDTDKNKLVTGDSWSSITVISFDMMGSKAYERIFNLKEIKDTDSGRMAIVKLSAIPAAEMPEQAGEKPMPGPLLNMFDNTETYTGRLDLDLTTGKVEKYSERLRSEWVAINLLTERNADEEPAVLTMGAIRFYSLERID